MRASCCWQPGMQNKDIAANVGLDRRQLALWRSRFLEGGIEALSRDAPRSARPASVMADIAGAHRAGHPYWPVVAEHG
jgi:transposase-like protein